MSELVEDLNALRKQLALQKFTTSTKEVVSSRVRS